MRGIYELLRVVLIKVGIVKADDERFPTTNELDFEWQDDLQFYADRDYRIQVALRRHHGQPPPPSIAFLLRETD